MTMKKKILSAAVLAALGAGTAQAVNVGNDGTGQVLLFPYYTVQGDETTLLSVVNSTEDGKLVKIRFREAYNSREVLDFNIYMSPKDVWTGAVVDSGAGAGAGVISLDETCTVPDLGTSVIPFRTFAYDGGVGAMDTGPQGVERTTEGYVEIIEMGIADPLNAVWDRDSNGAVDYVHIAGVPDNCAGIVQGVGSGWSAGVNGFNEGVLAPTGGLFGSLAIINIPFGTEISVNATALENVFDLPNHKDTGTLEPTLNDAILQSDMLVNDPVTNAASLLTEAWPVGIDSVSAVLMASNVMNEYTVNPAVAGETAWVITFPTKWGYADDQVVGYANPRAPFTTTFDEFPYGEACEEIGVTAYDREEAEVTPSGIDFSPSPVAPGINLCYEVNVMQVMDSSVMSSMNTTIHYNNLPGEGRHGWIDVNMAKDAAHTLGSHLGLPVLGFRASTIGNANIGVGAAYGTSDSHTYVRLMSATTAP